MISSEEWNEYYDTNSERIKELWKNSFNDIFSPDALVAKVGKPQEKPKNMYLLTLTIDPTKDKTEFVPQLDRILNRQTITFVKGAVEHVDANLHVHLLLVYTLKQRLRKENFKTYQRKVGNIDLKRVIKDNGISDYFDKEHGFDNYLNMKTFILSLK